MPCSFSRAVLLSLAGAGGLVFTQAADAPPYTVEPGLFDQTKPDLGLTRAAGLHTSTVFRPDAGTDRFSNGAVLTEFKGRFYAQWQSSARDEDAPDTWVAYATSDDGETWSAPRVLMPAGAGGPMHSNGGWWTDGQTLVAYINVWPEGFNRARGGHTLYRLSADGETWSEPQPVLDHGGFPVTGIIEQDPHRYDGRLHTAFHVQPGLVAQPHHTDDPLGVRGWTRGRMTNLPTNRPMSREIESSLFQRDHELVMVFRDTTNSHRQLASVSADRGRTWTRPVLTAMPDASAKQSAGNLPDGTAFLVNVPNTTRDRLPLAVTLGRDGRHFDRSYLLRGADDLPPLKTAGQAKRPGYHYPKSLVARGSLYVIYTTNKEAVEITRVPLANLTARAPR